MDCKECGTPEGQSCNVPMNESSAVEGTCDSCGSADGRHCFPNCEYHSPTVGQRVEIVGPQNYHFTGTISAISAIKLALADVETRNPADPTGHVKRCPWIKFARRAVRSMTVVA